MKEIIIKPILNGRGKPPRKDGTMPIQIRVYLNRKRRLYPSGICVSPQSWDKANRCVVAHPLADEINAELTAQVLSYQRYILDLRRAGKVPTLQQLDNFREYGSMESFIEFMEYEIEKDKSLGVGTKKQHRASLKKLVEFRPDTLFADLTYLWVQQFDAHLRGQGLATNSVTGHHKRINRYIKLALANEVYKGVDPYVHFRKKEEATTKTVLSSYEIQSIEALDLQMTPHLERIRDLFLFCCYTGLRGTDAIALRFCDIHRGRNGYNLDITAKKTKKQMLLPLRKLYAGKPEQLVQKYERTSGAHPTSKNSVFIASGESITNQYFNRELKKIAELAMIRKRLTSHVGRHTFATDMASRVPAVVVQRLLQHSSLKTTMGYVHLAQKAVNDLLDKIEWHY